MRNLSFPRQARWTAGNLDGQIKIWGLLIGFLVLAMPVTAQQVRSVATTRAAVSNPAGLPTEVPSTQDQHQQQSLQQLLFRLEKKFEVSFNYRTDLLKNIYVPGPEAEKVFNQTRVETYLQPLLASLRLVLEKKEGNRYLIYPAAPSSLVPEKSLINPNPAQAALTVTGKVTSETGEAMPGVTVFLKNTQIGTTTNPNGNFSLEIPVTQANGTLVFSFIGYASQEIKLAGQPLITVTLVPDSRALEEVVVVGYGTQKKSDVTGALTSVSTQDFKAQPVTRLDQALQGRVPGVQVISSAGAPGGDVQIRVRGTNSITGDNNPLYVVDGFVGAEYATLNPEDIATIEVLKDASATAIYGSRGANGVIIITTKIGKKGAMQVEVMSRVSRSEVIKKYNTLPAADFAEVVNARRLALTPAGSPYTPRFSEAEIAAYRQNGGTDWQDEIFRPAMGQEYQLGVSGGTDKTNYLFNTNYLNQAGIINNSDYRRYAIRSNIASQLSDKFSFRLNFTGTRRENHNTGSTAQRSGALAQALAWAPTTPVRRADGRYTENDPISSIFFNPVALTTEADNRYERTNTNLVSSLRYAFKPKLWLDVQVGINYLNQQDKDYNGPVITRNAPRASRASSEQITIQNINTLTYKLDWQNTHHLDFTGVFETHQFVANIFNVNVNGLRYPAHSYNNLALASSSLVGSGFQKWSLLSWLGRVNYSYKDRYLLAGALRRDGSSKFQGRQKFSVFPSLALGWRLSEEQFLQGSSWLANLKLRASWGLTGNQAIAPYGTLSTYVTNIDDAGVVFNAHGGITPGILMGNPGNPDLQWETTEQLNAGADVELLAGRIYLTADYFVKNTRDLLLSQQLPGYLGGYAMLKNVGAVQNKGWELLLGGTAVQRQHVKWTSALNFSFIRNQVVSLGHNQASIPLNQFILMPGQSLATFWGYRYLGTWKPAQADEAAAYGLKPGDARYADTDNNQIIDEKDYQVIGSGMPQTALGWNNTIAYKAISLNIFWQGLLGFDKLNYTYAYGMVGSTDAKEVLFADIKNRYIPGVNETSDIPAFSSAPSNAYTQSSRFIQSGDFIRLKNISLTYNLPKTAIKGINNARLFISGTNLLTLTRYRGIDPEANSNSVFAGWEGYGSDAQQGLDFGAYPNAKMYTAGISLTF